MSPPVARINTYIQKTNYPIVEPISKFFIIGALILGVNRLAIIRPSNIYCTLASSTYVISKYLVLVGMAVQDLHITGMWVSLFFIDCVHYLNCILLGCMLHKRLKKYYLELNNIDKYLCIKATTFGIRETVYNLLQLLMTITATIALNVQNKGYGFSSMGVLIVMSVKFMNSFELHYYGHLFSLMIPRLKAMSDGMKSAYPGNTKLTISPNNETQTVGTKSHLNINKLMVIYNNIINAYDVLNGAIKWQMLSFLISIFILTLCLTYTEFKMIIWNDVELREIFILSISLATVQMCPLLVPCVFADRVQKEVQVIKDFVACKLYENTLDKQSRSTARSLLALMNTRNLSFSLFHMFDIDISLPIKFTALLVTYLIILLQFDKVISPAKST